MGIFDLFKKKDKMAPITQMKPLKETVSEEEKSFINPMHTIRMLLQRERLLNAK